MFYEQDHNDLRQGKYGLEEEISSIDQLYTVRLLPPIQYTLLESLPFRIMKFDLPLMSRDGCRGRSIELLAHKHFAGGQRPAIAVSS